MGLTNLLIYLVAFLSEIVSTAVLSRITFVQPKNGQNKLKIGNRFSAIISQFPGGLWVVYYSIQQGVLIEK